MSNDFGLEYWDETFVPTGNAVKVDDLVAGEYRGQIRSAVLEKANNGATIVKWILVIESGPCATRQTLEHTSWLTDGNAVGRFGGELATLGIDTASWIPPLRPFSRMLPLALQDLSGSSARWKISPWTSKKTGATTMQLKFLVNMAPAEITVFDSQENLAF
jgi:hypothetical protein